MLSIPESIADSVSSRIAGVFAVRKGEDSESTSGAGSDLTRGDRYRSRRQTADRQIRQLYKTQRESCYFPENTFTMAATNGTGATPAPQAVNQISEDVSVSQRMVSATLGSILTSVLGE